MSGEENVPAAEELVPKRSSTSEIWGYFGFKKTDISQSEVLCKQCRKTALTKRGNTTNLFSHLKQHHVREYEECMAKKPSVEPSTSTCESSSTKAKQTSISEAFMSATPYATNSCRFTEITEAITYHIAEDMAPLETVNQTGFKKMLNTLDKRYIIPSRTHFSQAALPALYKKGRGKIKDELKQAEFYSTTSDLWSSRTMEPYISLTIHYIDGDFKLRNKCLQTAYFPQDFPVINKG